MNYSFSVPGEPVAQPRQRFAVGKSGKPRAYKDDKHPVHAYKLAVALATRVEIKKPLDGPVGVNLIFVVTKPKSRPKSDEWCYVKPDIDNYVKAVFDAVNGIAWHDDGQVSWTQARKKYHIVLPHESRRAAQSPEDGPRTYIDIWTLDTNP